jgi:DnaK suppressor protein
MSSVSPEQKTLSRKEVIEKNKLHLQSRRDELRRWLSKNNGVGDLRLIEAMDRIERTSMGENIVATHGEIARKKDELTCVERFLKLIDDDKYGICKECEGEIQPGRLEAVPTTDLCIICASARNRKK